DVLESYIHSVSRALDWWYGPIIARTHTDTFDGGCGRVWLTQRPITSVTSVTVDGAALNADEWRAGRSIADRSTLSGHVEALSGSAVSTFNAGLDNVVVVYTAGRYADRVNLDPRFRQAAVITLQHAWRAEQHTVFEDPDGFVAPRSGYPKEWDLNAVKKILSGERRHRHGFA
ncbi:MAG: hypothetical protein GY925_18880, partial [Actinomycetia bacterium]|nr:hypothetical protein [Actinomycetes bacterium]